MDLGKAARRRQVSGSRGNSAVCVTRSSRVIFCRLRAGTSTDPGKLICNRINPNSFHAFTMSTKQ